MTSNNPTPAPPVTFVLFGAMGDLAGRLLLPAINMASQDLLHQDFRIVGVDAREGSDEDLRNKLERFRPNCGDDAQGRAAAWRHLRDHIFHVHCDFTQSRVYSDIADRMGASSAHNVIFYAPIPNNWTVQN